jgi:hypothetical protein
VPAPTEELAVRKVSLVVEGLIPEVGLNEVNGHDPQGGVLSRYTVYRWLHSLHITIYKRNSNKVNSLNLKLYTLKPKLFFRDYSSSISVTMTNQQGRDNPDPKNIIPDDKKQKRNATNGAQGLDSQFYKLLQSDTNIPSPSSRQYGGHHTLYIVNLYVRVYPVTDVDAKFFKSRCLHSCNFSSIWREYECY